MKNITLTDLEKKILFSLINNLYAEPGFSDVGVKEIANELDMSNNQVKGVIGSLCKKEVIVVGENEYQDCIYLNNSFWYLHPEWKNEMIEEDKIIITNL